MKPILMIATLMLSSAKLNAQNFTKLTGDPVVGDGGYEGSSRGDINNDGCLDLFVCNYYGINNILYQNDGDGSSRKVTEGSL